MTARTLVLAGALVVATALAGCGKIGRLEPAAPLFGDKTRSAPAETRDPTRSIETVDPRDRSAVDPNPPIPAPAPPTPQP
jgi:hypothetical protein